MLISIFRFNVFQVHTLYKVLKMHTFSFASDLVSNVSQAKEAVHLRHDMKKEDEIMMTMIVMMLYTYQYSNEIILTPCS